MTYQPQPIDTTGVELDPEIEKLTESLAKHAHDVWALNRIRAGWKEGEIQDCSAQENPRIVPFADLTEEEKGFDRRAALEPIKVLQSRGWRFVPPGPSALPESTGNDDPILLARQAWESEIKPTFDLVDREARSHQFVHNICTIAAAIAGTSAVLLAIAQLSGYTPRFTPESEIIAASTALISVFLGVVSTRLPRWLLYRYKAERLRSMEFQLLADRDLWSGDPARIKSRLDRVAKDVEVIIKTSPRRLHRWLVQTPAPSPLAGYDAPTLSHVSVSGLANHYLVNRVVEQKKFFRERYQRLSRLDSLTRIFPPFIFFLSVLFAFFHFIFHMISHQLAERGNLPLAEAMKIIGSYCTILAASLPVFGAGVRTLRSAFEYGRNKLRYRAAHLALTRLTNRINARFGNTKDSASVFRDLTFCEQVLEHEHREWLRLMIEAEWYA